MFKLLIGLLFMVLSSLSLAAVDLNKASQADLETIKGIGPAMSGRILDERKKGEFKDWLDFIDRIKGIGPGNASKFSEAGLTVNGSTYTAPAGAAKAASRAGKVTDKMGDKKP
jgi:competence protein ComEA